MVWTAWARQSTLSGQCRSIATLMAGPPPATRNRFLQSFGSTVVRAFYVFVGFLYFSLLHRYLCRIHQIKPPPSDELHLPAEPRLRQKPVYGCQGRPRPLFLLLLHSGNSRLILNYLASCAPSFCPGHFRSQFGSSSSWGWTYTWVWHSFKIPL